MQRIRVLIVDDHALVRSGLRALLSGQSDIEVVGEGADGTVAENLCRLLAPDVVLMDLTMPARGGIGAIEDVRRSCPSTRVVVLTMHEDEVYARQALLAGASGYVLKKALATELLDAIRSIHRGGSYLAPSLAGALIDVEPAASHPRRASSALDSLSERERQVLRLLALGHTNTEIGGRLFISEKTVETHRARILAKLGLRTRADLVRFALEHDLMSA